MINVSSKATIRFRYFLIHQKIIQSKQTGQNNLSQNLRKTEVDPLEDQSE